MSASDAAAFDESDRLHARVQAVVAAYARHERSPETFDAIAADLARFQARRVPGYGRLCAARGVVPEAIARAEDAPAVPTDAFKLATVFAFPLTEAAATFRTSGTTLGAHGVHAMRTAATYDACALAFARSMLAAGMTRPTRVLVLGPSPREAPDSSLTHMCALLARRLDLDRREDASFFVRDGRLDIAGLRAHVEALEATRPVLVLATSFALVHLLDALGDDMLPLPVGSRAMQTGGFKGRSREVAPDALRRAVARAFALREAEVVGEYGMTELSSQFWEATAVLPDARPGVYVEPPWAHVVPVDPETLHPVPAGAMGIARIEDLGNVDSAFAVLAQDRVRRVPGGFELLGRAPGAPARGCSIAIDEMLSAHDSP